MGGHGEGLSLVIGASGFLGSHVTRELVAQGRPVRILVREHSDTRGTDGLDIQRLRGSVFDPAVLSAALQGVDTVYYCVLDPRSWLRDTRPLWETNVHRLPAVLDLAARFPLRKFVYTSSLVTIGLRQDGPACEADAFNWADQAPEYVLTRVAGERCALERARANGLPLVVCNVANTFGPGDYAPTAHGQMLRDAASGRLPIYYDGGLVCVGIIDAARGMILAVERGRVGERYILSERYLSLRELFTLAARAAGREPRHVRLPYPLMQALAHGLEAITRPLGLDNRMAPSSLRLTRLITGLDNRKAREELGWQPGSIEEAVMQAVAFYQTQARSPATGA